MGEIFFDVASIEPGADFVAAIKHALGRDPVCLVMIGPSWRGPRSDGGMRIDQAEDVVRNEVEAALAGGLRLIPVLANGATMPQPHSLPEALQPLSSLSAVALRHDSFDQDMDRLIDAILRRRRDGLLARLRTEYPGLASVAAAVAGMLSAAGLLLAFAVLHRVVLGRSLEDTLGGPGPVWVLIVMSLAVGSTIGFLRSRRPV